MDKKIWKVYLKEGDVRAFLVTHTVEEMIRITAGVGCVLTSTSGSLVFVNESNIACIVEQTD